jgi:uncharacterized protein (DUF983 family)
MSLNAVVTQRCPKCEDGKMFKGILKMNQTCTHCGFKFEREEGYYTMSIVIANFFYALIVAPTILIMTALDVPIWKIAVILGAISMVVIPLIFRLSRTLWLHFDFATHRE